MKTCYVCKEEPVVNSGKCRACYNAYMLTYTTARYHRRRKEAIEKLGGTCTACGANENLEFDHKDPADKALDISKVLTHSWAKIDAELAKCQLLCNSCHIEKSYREGDLESVEHGGGITGKRNCRCELCGPLKNAYMREFKKAAKAKIK